MLKMEVVVPPPIMDFDFNDARPMPFLSAPSTPKRFGDCSLSAPTSPSRFADFYRRFDEFASDANSTPVSPKAAAAPNNSGGDDFAFDFRSELEENSLSAEELFDGGKIRPLKPPPRLQTEERSPLLSSRSPRSPIAQGKRIISESASRKWRLRDFLLFRSASEGRAADKDPLRTKYPSFFRKPEDAKNTSFRSTDSSGSVSAASRRKGPVSAHELHYTKNKAASEDLKKKTFLPYKQGILGRLAFNPTAHALVNGFGSLAR
ncbi:hypothetical protein GH714_005485 [Hevea brasiliensis]|uniref:Calmodulin-binding protein n=1 Tax=Hevea brasiliensis TaxID=3981 RepID=A0A6A6M9G1_HEVBR|nr:hypothetical protein GH714_005485 [Hevea brasiliensis]